MKELEPLSEEELEKIKYFIEKDSGLNKEDIQRITVTITFLEKVIKKQDDHLVRCGKEIMLRENQRADMQYESEQLQNALKQLIESSECYLATAHEVARGSLQDDVYAAKKTLRGERKCKCNC